MFCKVASDVGSPYLVTRTEIKISESNDRERCQHTRDQKNLRASISCVSCSLGSTFSRS